MQEHSNVGLLSQFLLEEIIHHYLLPHFIFTQPRSSDVFQHSWTNIVISKCKSDGSNSDKQNTSATFRFFSKSTGKFVLEIERNYVV